MVFRLPPQIRQLRQKIAQLLVEVVPDNIEDFEVRNRYFLNDEGTMTQIQLELMDGPVTGTLIVDVSLESGYIPHDLKLWGFIEFMGNRSEHISVLDRIPADANDFWLKELFTVQCRKLTDGMDQELKDHKIPQ